MAKGDAVFRRRRAQWSGLRPTWDRTGLWPQYQWAWWTWDYIPAPVAKSVGTVVDDLRGTPGFIVRGQGTPGDRDDTPAGFSREWTGAMR